MLGISGGFVMKNPRIFFETIHVMHLPVLVYYLLRGWAVSVFDFSGTLKRNRLLRSLINRGRIHRIYIRPIHPAHGDAIDQTERIFTHLRAGWVPRTLARLYQNPETDLAFKKILVREVFKCLYINYYLRERSDVVRFVPWSYHRSARLLRRHSDIRLAPLPTVRWASLCFACMVFVEHLLWRGVLLGYMMPRLLCALVAKGCAISSGGIARYAYGIALDQAFQIKFDGKRGFDWLLDHQAITKANTLFFVNFPAPAAWLASKQREGYQFYDTRRAVAWRAVLSSPLPWPAIARLWIACCRLLVAGMGDPALFRCGVLGLQAALKWQIVFRQVGVHHYLYTNQEGFSQIYINLLVKQHGGSTWNYSSFIGGGLLYARNGDFAAVRNVLWAFLNSDHFLAVSPAVIDYYKLHAQQIRHYCAIGSIYSQMVREIAIDGDRSAWLVRTINRDLPSQARIVAFFDTSFVDSDEVMTSYDDALVFYRDILRLLAESPQLFVVIKPSKEESYFIAPAGQWSSVEKGHRLLAVWKELQQHPRVHWAGHHGDVPSIIAMSDLVVTHCLSSPTAEAIGAGKKAIWYESGEKHRGVLFDRIPGLIVHGYDALVVRIAELLEDTAYPRYIEQYIKGAVETHVDGMALSRLRQIISQS